MTGARKKPDPESPAPREAGGAAPKPRGRKKTSHSFYDGLEAAVIAGPEDFPGTRPRTMLSLMVRELVKQAATGRSAPIKTVMGFIRDGERDAAAEERAQSQGICSDECRAGPRFEWSDGSWDASEREAPPPKPIDKAAEAAKRAEAKAAHQARVDRLVDKMVRAAEADRLNEQREMRLAAERGLVSPNGKPGSGNIQGPETRDAPDGCARIAGRVVER